MKAVEVSGVKKFQDIPNVGPAMERDFLLLGFTSPNELIIQNPFTLYKKLEKITGKKQDPCVLDTYMAVIDFMNGAKAKPWYHYTMERKNKYKEL